MSSFKKFYLIALFAGFTALSGLSVAHACGDCKADREKFCGTVQRGDGRIKQCMKDHYNDLSAACKTKMDEKAANQSQGK